MVDSTRLSHLMDPEDLLAIFKIYQEVCTRQINYYGGTVARFIGDGILAYFGYPQAHEDDAERAMQAGLRIIDEIPKLNGQFNNPEEVPIAVRIGAATGLTVVGDIIGPGASELQSATGETPNLAARMQSLAESNSLVIPMNTLKLIGGFFRYEDLGYHQLKGFDQPIKAWKVLGEISSESRFEATHRAKSLPMVDREEEIETLQRRWERVCQGKGNVVLLAGEAGIGKSRLVQMLLDSIDVRNNIRLGFQCYPYYSSSPYYPLLRTLQNKAGLSAEKPLRVNLGRLRHILSGDSAAKSEVIESIWPLFANFSATVEHLENEVLDGIGKVRLHEVLLDQIRRMASELPVVIVIEDLHWLDPSSEELLDELIQGISDLPILCLLTFRPQYRPRWMGQPEATFISINRLDQEYRRQLVNNVCRDRRIPDKLIDLIADKTDGVPLFVEEVTKTLLESSDYKLQGSSDDEGMIQHLSIPSSLQDSLIARLDQLAPVKEVTQVASVAGREVSHNLLQHVLGWKSEKLEDAIDQLVSAELMLRHGRGQDARYVFRHALIRDAAYEGMLRRKRAGLHLKVALVLEESVSSIRHAEPEILAYHFEEAARFEKQSELLVKSAEYWLEAGLRCNRQSAYRESEKQLQQGIGVLQECEDGVSRQRLERDLQTALGNVLIQNEGPGSGAVAEAFARAAELSLDRAGEATDSVREFAIKWGRWRTCLDIPQSKQIVDEMLEIATGEGNADLLLEAYHAQWPTCFYLGELKHCCDAVKHGLAIYQEDRHVEHRAFFGGHDTRVCGHGQAALANWLLGHPDESAMHIHNAVELAQISDHKPSLAHALDYDVMLSYMMGDRDRTRRIATELYELSNEQKFPDYLDRARTFLGWCLVHEGEVSAGMKELESGLAAQRRVGTQEDFEVFGGMHAECLLQAGLVQEAAAEYQQALSQASEHSMFYWQGELSRRIGTLAHQQGDPDLSRSSLLQAISLNESQGANNLLVRALRDFIQMFPDEADACRKMLGDIYTENPRLFELPDFRDILSPAPTGTSGTDA
jgi:class 3 adenylate cyclase/predicted ATPase